MSTHLKHKAPNPWALLPLAVFVICYLVVSLLAGDFYKMPITVAFCLSGITAIAFSKGGKLQQRINHFCSGAANGNVMLMVLIFILAGAFAETAKATGSIDATVNLAMALLPSELLATGIFIAACFISLSVGTSVGTIVALAPIAVGIATKMDFPPSLLLGCTISGAMFGDNLSFISDTTIIASRTQGCSLSDKFKHNIRIALPIAVLTGIIYYFISSNQPAISQDAFPIEWEKVLPYIVVLLMAIKGINVLIVLLIGILLTSISGWYTHAFDAWGCLSAMSKGINNMGELIIISLLAAGTLEMIRYNGGIAWIIERITARTHSSKGAEVSIAALVSFANVCTANNTIALIMAGPIAKDIATKYNVDPRRSASLLDIFSCFVQGTLPYGAQILIASSLGRANPLDIMQYLYYPYLLGASGILAILCNYPRKFTHQ